MIFPNSIRIELASDSDEKAMSFGEVDSETYAAIDLIATDQADSDEDDERIDAVDAAFTDLI